LKAYDIWFKNCPKNAKTKKDFEKVYAMEIRFKHKWKQAFYKRNYDY
jgi:hypothetical protein